MDLKTYIRDVPDFPKKGIVFRDISPLLANPKAWQEAVDQLCRNIETYEPDALAGIDARGFLVAAPVACQLGIGFSMIRKKGKLPWNTVDYTYELEYGSDVVEMHGDAFTKGQKVVVCDDLLATGGTAQAACELVRKVDADPVSLACLIELEALKGRDKLGIPVTALMTY